ncbi:hypothetical protein RDWZM_006507 [Blomia tropicalis]|uniref:Protein kinase domain-containing protein n=1 Tax=Blomia tropicalis TaxID=40697 RepID=A0A9Q0M7V9_BLOTA|nr:hypothetical protein RDWZM_006507 [Blomia tropicalis]
MLALKDFKKKVGRKVNHAIKGKFASGSFLNDTEDKAGPSNEEHIENDICFFDLQKEVVNQTFEVSNWYCVVPVRSEQYFHASPLKMVKKHSKKKKYFPAYLAMKFEFLETDLKNVAKKMGRFSIETLIPIAKQIGSAIAYMHSKKIINHDIKPANIMVEKLDHNGNIGANSVYKLIDFGLAHHTNHPIGSEAKCEKFMGGTMNFMCPEKIGRNNIREYDLYLSDSYSFGATLFSLLFGYKEYSSTIRNMKPGDLFMHYLKTIWECEITHPYFLSIIGKLLTHQFRQRVNQKFEVSELVLCGSGAFGTVFSCYATKNGEKTFEQLAIKVIRAESLATSSLKKWKRRSKREMYYLHKLEHENIVKLHDYLWLNNPEKKHFPAYLAMKFEYLETDLEKMAKKMRTFSVDLLIPIAKQIGSAIAYMHSKKIINHDIKPANIMVEKLEQNGNIGANSVYKLIDFGLARHTDHPLGSEAKCDKFMGGTLIFTCPEKIGRNKKREYDLYLSDSYSFGATLFSLLFGYNEYVTRMRNMNPGDLFMQYLNVAWEFEITHPYFFSIIGHLLTHQFRRKYVKDILEMLENPEQHPIDYYFYKPPDGFPILKY